MVADHHQIAVRTHAHRPGPTFECSGNINGSICRCGPHTRRRVSNAFYVQGIYRTRPNRAKTFNCHATSSCGLANEKIGIRLCARRHAMRDIRGLSRQEFIISGELVDGQPKEIVGVEIIIDEERRPNNRPLALSAAVRTPQHIR